MLYLFLVTMRFLYNTGGQDHGRKTDRGIYREWSKAPQYLNPGDVVNIPAGVKHRHGAAADSWFSHLAIEVPGEGAHTEWFDADTEV